MRHSFDSRGGCEDPYVLAPTVPTTWIPFSAVHAGEVSVKSAYSALAWLAVTTTAE